MYFYFTKLTIALKLLHIYKQHYIRQIYENVHKYVKFVNKIISE